MTDSNCVSQFLLENGGQQFGVSQDHPDAWSLLAQQAERHGAARRELLDCCNQDSFGTITCSF